MDSRFEPVADALRRGNKIEAIRLFRELTGMGLKEAKEAIDRLEAEGVADEPAEATDAPPASTAEWTKDEAFLTDVQRDLAALRAPRDPSTPALEGELADAVAALASQHKYIDAIKLVRARTGVDLKTAKDQVEGVMEQRGIAKQSSKGCISLGIGIIIFIVAIVLGLVFMR